MEGDVMKSRMDRYNNDQDQGARTAKNQNLYGDIYSSTLSSSNVALLDNESEIDISKIKELVQNREGYKRVKELEPVLQTKTAPLEEEKYDIYEDIDNKIYDINMILEEAKAKRPTSDREKYRSLKNTQYNILSNLNLNEEKEEDEMVTDFFTQDKTMKSLVTSFNDEDKEEKEKTRSDAKTSVDLFEDLKGNNGTVLTEPVKEEKPVLNKTDEANTFYTSHMNFTKEDFEDFQILQTTVKKNNRLIKVLITTLIVVLVAIVIFLVFAIL
jgi:hypothetical protein